jgi:hypothetical protein
MIELLIIIALIVGISRMAEADNMSGVKWGAITMLACIVAVAIIPLPFIRVLIAGVGVFAGMVAVKGAASR